ncbi:hypothetical protein E4634_03455 [Mangrovimicrobium sediminis]|uniref:Uncharacterized protein n=1 Tax=Mangrovimicrobium sediminis TaxID=2562682 RepID=A0A4Z0M6P4_9GAMM|nr:hypothetical protein [Haliea sp. SAOS-164]TGD75080.1 hypothetical protein E4634_03455 [Haliea sp. SAOS-164]
MKLDTYKADNLLFNANFCDATSEPGLAAYRGDLVIVDGGLDDKGHPNPPHEVLRGAVVLAGEDIKLLIGSLDQIEMLPTLLERFGADLAADASVMLFVVNASERAQFDYEGRVFTIIPLVQGVCWNEAIDELALEKSDFKGQTPADKVATLYGEMKSYRAKGAVKSMDELLAATTSQVREAWGAV